MRSIALDKIPHRRFNPLLREWVLVSPQRLTRPWQGKVAEVQQTATSAYDPSCYLCPGNERHAGVRNPRYEHVFTFQNDYPALIPEIPLIEYQDQELLVGLSESGICRVMCFSPRHDLTISRMSQAEASHVVQAWREQFNELDQDERFNHVQIFENRGELMGASNPHPHCQIWANATVPNIPERELDSFLGHYNSRQSCLLCDYLSSELARDERVVCQNDAFAVVVPYWAVWPFETLVLPKRHLAAMDELLFDEREALADILRRIVIRYDNLFQTPCPYSMGFHQRPSDGDAHPEWHFHAHYYPPLLRSANVQKFMVGYEMLASPQRDLTAEGAARRLVEAGETHYLDRNSPSGK